MILYEEKVLGALSTVGAGTTVAGAANKYGEGLMSQLLPAHAAIALRENVFAAVVPPGTGVATTTTISTTAMYNLHNPSGSGKLLVILSGSLGYVSGTLGAGTVYWVANTAPVVTAPSGGTPITPVKTLVSAAASGAVALPTFGSTVVAPSILRPAFVLGAALASTAGIWPVLKDDVLGMFIVGQGCSIGFQSHAAAGSSPLVSPGMVWAEVPA